MTTKIEQLNIEIFGGCNYHCQVCPQSKELGGREKDFLKRLPFDVLVKVVEDAATHGVRAVSLHGSGEPTMHPGLVEMVEFVASRGLKPSIFTNGFRLNGELFERLIDAGIDLVTVSLIGANREEYKKYMDSDRFEAVMQNLHECKEVMTRNSGKGVFHTRHLLMNQDRKDDEVSEYRDNIVNPLGCMAEIWMPHNWGGQYASAYNRFEHAPKKLRSCGRPFAATLEVRAGGLNGHFAAVVPCPFVLGKDSQAVLGHLDTQSMEEVLQAESLAQLRRAHREERFDDISYCKGCDMLADDQEVLVWSNIPGRYVGQSKTSTVDYPRAAP